MTLEDVKKKIHFSDVPPLEEWGHPKRRAAICISAEVGVSPRESHPPMSEIDEVLTHRILASLYDDRRREIQETLFELRVANPFDMYEYRAKIDKLEKLLAYGPPI